MPRPTSLGENLSRRPGKRLDNDTRDERATSQRAPSVSKWVVDCLMSLVVMCGMAPALAAPQNKPLARQPVSLTGGVSTFAAGADRQANSSPGLRSLSPTIDLSSSPPHQLRAERFSGYAIDARQIRALAKYDVELIIDRSLSMRRGDCPGGLSRWDWCAYQAEEISRALIPFAPNGLTISRFATEFDVHEHMSAQDVAYIMRQNDFQFGTRLSEPLAARLDAFFARHRRGDKPLMIAVITDGRPFPRPEPRIVRDVLVRASHRMAEPDEVKVVFLQIGGDDPRGRAYLLDLGTNLLGYGARFQYVQTVTFDELTRIGVARALIDAAQPRRATPG